MSDCILNENIVIITTRKDNGADWMGKSMPRRGTYARNGSGLIRMSSEEGYKEVNRVKD